MFSVTEGEFWEGTKAAAAAEKRAQRETSDCMFETARKKSYLTPALPGEPLAIHTSRDGATAGNGRKLRSEIKMPPRACLDAMSTAARHQRHAQERLRSLATHS